MTEDERFLHPKEHSASPGWVLSLRIAQNKNNPILETRSQITLLLSSPTVPKALRPLLTQHDFLPVPGPGEYCNPCLGPIPSRWLMFR